MNIKKLTLKSSDFPEALRNIPHPPKVLYRAGAPLNELLKRPSVAIVGSRSISTYGRKVTIDLAGQLAEQGVVIISGLAFGVDYTAHRAALDLEDHQTAAREVRGRNAHEQTVLDLMLQGVNEGEQLLKRSELSTSQFNQVLIMLEIGGKIRPLGANHWAIY